MIDAFSVEQGVGGEAGEDLGNDMVCEASHCVHLVGVLCHFKEPAIISV